MELLNVSDLSVRIASDRESIVIEARNGTVPVPLKEVLALGVREGANPHACQTIATGFASTGRSYWIELVRRDGSPWQLGPLAASDATRLALAFDRWFCEQQAASGAAAKSYIDELTGLLDHRALRSELRLARLASHDAGRATSFALLDLDELKRFNEARGRAAGDGEICRFAWLVGMVMMHDVVVRWAGDQLAIVFPSTALYDASLLVEHVLLRMRHRSVLTFSGGVIELGENEPFEQVLSRASAALAVAKRRGGNCVVTG